MNTRLPITRPTKSPISRGVTDFLEGRLGPVSQYVDDFVTPVVVYSLRRLIRGYSGYGIRLRRTSDNATHDIGFLSDDTLDVAACVSFLAGSNGTVNGWYNQVTGALQGGHGGASVEPLLFTGGSFDGSAYYDGNFGMAAGIHVNGIYDQTLFLRAQVIKKVGPGGALYDFRSFLGGRSGWEFYAGSNVYGVQSSDYTVTTLWSYRQSGSSEFGDTVHDICTRVRLAESPSDQIQVYKNGTLESGSWTGGQSGSGPSVGPTANIDSSFMFYNLQTARATEARFVSLVTVSSDAISEISNIEPLLSL